MYCRKCGNKISEGSKYCPYCGAEQKPKQVTVQYEKDNPFLMFIYILSIISLSFAIFAIHEIMMILGILSGIVSLIAGIIIRSKKVSNRATRSIIFSIAGILANVSWLLFTILIL
ncbi:MAG TPA: zinc ribbon domain-containing protein [Bacilli bacterium]